MSYSRFVPHDNNIPYSRFESVAKECSDSDIIVEVGAYLGHGTCYMAECLVAYNKRPKFYAIDIWDQKLDDVYGKNRVGNMPWGQPMMEFFLNGGNLYEMFLFYINNCPHKDRIFDYVQFPASTCMQEFEDDSVSFVFLNYTQDEKAVQEEVINWWPKMKKCGKIVIACRPDAPMRELVKA